jgi:hypothetical protein
LIDHPVYTLTSPWQHVGEILVPQNMLSYAPERYVPVFTWLFGSLFFLNSLWALLLIATLTLVVTLVAKSWRSSPAFWLVLGFLALFFPHFYLVWHGDAAEVGRHAVQASVQLRLALWLLILLALDKIVERIGNLPRLKSSG